MAVSNCFFFDNYSEAVSKGVFQWGSHTFKSYLSNTTPVVGTMTTKSQLAEISVANEANHGNGGANVTATISRSGAISTMGCTNYEYRASGGTVGPFRYVVLYDDTDSNDTLVGYWDYGSALTLADGDKFQMAHTSSRLMTSSSSST